MPIDKTIFIIVIFDSVCKDGKKKSLRWERGLETVLELVDADME